MAAGNLSGKGKPIAKGEWMNHSIAKNLSDFVNRVALFRFLVLPLVFALCSLVGATETILNLSDSKAKSPPGKAKLRVFVETDAGGDPDDEQSMVRFLLYAKEWDIEGIICTLSVARKGENLNPERTGLGIVRRLIQAYGACFPNLLLHDPDYPKPEWLLERTVSGYEDSEEGVNRIVAAVDAPDPRPIWFMNWGTAGSASSSLKRALDRVLKERGPSGYAAFKKRICLSSSDQFGEHTTRILPPFPIWVDTFRPEMDKRRWYWRFSAITAKAGGFDIQRDMLTGHGPLGALYPTNTTHKQKEGDSMSFLYLVPTGMNDPRHPNWGSWAGRYGPNPAQKGLPYYWANQPDTWQGTTHRENSLIRFAVDLQNDFRARLEYCVKPFKGANHPPQVILNQIHGTEIVHLAVTPGQSQKMSAVGSKDPDGNALSYDWRVYAEAGSYPGKVTVQNANNPEAEITLPKDLGSDSIHILLTVKDSGIPSLTRYRRVVFTAK